MDKDTGCLIIHGFGGNIAEIAPLAEYLSQKGFTVVCPELKGHTGRRRDLGRANYREWIDSAEEKLMYLKSRCSNIVIIGFSMGGLISVNLALRYKTDAVITLNMPIFYWDFKRISMNIKDDFRNNRYNHLKGYIRSSINKPLSSLINFKILLQKTKPLLKEVKCPVLIMQALEDDTVQPRSAEYIYNNVSSINKELKYYEGSGHLICLSSAACECFEDISNFINAVLNADLK